MGKATAAIDEKMQMARMRAAQRMRRSRSRRREGLRCYTLELRESEIGALVRRGLLSPDEQGNRVAVISAMHTFLDRAFGW